MPGAPANPSLTDDAALAGALAGLDVTVFPGSWSQWSNTRGQPVAVGILPDGRLTKV